MLNQFKCLPFKLLSVHLSVHISILYLVLVVGIVMTQVSNQPDEVSLEADDRREGGRVSISTEVLSSTENILTALSYSVHLFQKFCRENVKG